LVSPDGLAPCRMVSVSASVNLSLHHKVQKFSSGTGSPGWSRKKGHKMVVVVWWFVVVTVGEQKVASVSILFLLCCFLFILRIVMQFLEFSLILCSVTAVFE